MFSRRTTPLASTERTGESGEAYGGYYDSSDDSNGEDSYNWVNAHGLHFPGFPILFWTAWKQRGGENEITVGTEYK